MRRLVPILLPVLLAVTLVGCGQGDGGNGGGGSDRSPTPGALPAVTGPLGKKPTIATPQGTPPRSLVVQDLAAGSGAQAKAGQTVTMHYVGVSWSTGEEFDSSWSRNEPLTYALSGLIQGWQEGIPGMQVGGRRLLVIPPEKGYGVAGQGPIRPNETLVFVVDLLGTR